MTLNVPVRPDILTSWQRSVVAGLRPDRFQVPYRPDFDDDGLLRWAAAQVLDQVADELEGSGVGLLLTDASGQVVDRRAADSGILARLDRIELAPGFLYGESLIGTNAIGTAIAQQAPSVVTGTEHFADALASMACAAIPVTDGTSETIGVIDLTCAAEDFNPLLLPFARRAAGEIGHRLREGANLRRLSVSSWLNLTDTERMVAHLAAQGLNSRVVADRMLLPWPTVRSHLRQVFRKLGIRSQTELARVVEQAAGRARTMAAVDNTRQQIQRDLHDGLQQRLVTLGLQVRAAEASIPTSATELKWELTQVADGLMGVLHDVREISRGIHPAMLSEGGLGPALNALARRSPVPVDLTVRVAGRLPDRVELGAYYIISEALANVAKHANAETVMVSVETDRGTLRVSVRDDGVGGADPDGSGLTGLRERAAALDGTLNLTSQPGRGTSVDVRLPAAPR
ncbi:MAG TPA: ATP-binding protein [Trebonia sp.]|jgi:signal transduction histidine kinase|nr:ATP-binding protein [Trebonia sp.]